MTFSIRVIDLANGKESQNVRVNSEEEGRVQLQLTPGQCKKEEAKYRYDLIRTDSDKSVTILDSVFTKVHHARTPM